jgi:diaminohydroxyphosphoribosylaminopyrimidine deaminase/5-amino-6-(5-phosphoribosylamino)uracil reductase
MKRKHEYFMGLAMKLGLRAKGLTSPNPLVGALVVKNTRIISRGFHKKAGSAHAEVVALDKAKGKAKGATLYVTLEPCSHYGRTPPCVDKIIKSGIKKVIVGMLDPNPRNFGKGIEMLRRHNIEVECGCLESKLKNMNEVFIKYITRKLPFVTIKVGQSLDGKIATYRSDSQWITEECAREYSRRRRGYYDAIMVGVNTILRDNPRLDALGSSRQPVKIIVDSQLSIPHDANIFQREGKVIIATLLTEAGQETENRGILAEKAKILEIKEKNGQVNLRSLLKKLAGLEITSILVEGGGNLIGSLFDDALVDKVLFFIAPKIIGGKDAVSSVMGRGIARIDEAIRLERLRFERIGEDFLVEGYVKYPCSRG